MRNLGDESVEREIVRDVLTLLLLPLLLLAVAAAVAAARRTPAR